MTFGQHTSRYGMIALLGAFMIMTLPFTGMLNLWLSVWITVPVMLAAFGVAVSMGVKLGGKWILYAGLVAGGMSFGVAIESYDERRREAAEALGPISAQDIEKHRDALAFKLVDGTFNVGEVEGWHEVCGEDDCTEYVLLSLTLPGETKDDPIRYWFEVRLNDVFGPDYVFETDTSSRSQEEGIKRACRADHANCSAEALILTPISPVKGDLATIRAAEVLGFIAGTVWFIPCFFGWAIGSFKLGKRKK